MIRVGIAGGAGYTAGELLRLLINHPSVEIKYIQSESHKGEPISSVHNDLLYSQLTFSDIDFEDMYDPELNVEYGTFLLKFLFDEFEHPENVLCAYHAGRSCW